MNEEILTPVEELDALLFAHGAAPPPVVEEKEKDERNPSFTKKGPGRRHGSSSPERRTLRALHRAGIVPAEVKSIRKLVYMHAAAKRRELKRMGLTEDEFLARLAAS